MDISLSLQELAQWFFETLGLDFSDLSIQEQDAENHIYSVKISSTDSPLLIGPHGKTLEEIQTLLAQMTEKKLGIRCLIHVEINDYLAEKQRKLFSIVDRKIELTRKNGIEQVMYDLSGYERKQIHAYISEKYADIATKSQDGERGRELHIMLKEGHVPTGNSVERTYDTASDLEALDLDGTNI